MQPELVERLHAALPQARAWMAQFVAAHAERARPVSTYPWRRLRECYPAELLERVRVVPVDAVVFPPVEEFGLPELAGIHEQQLFGITFQDTFFVRKDRQFEALFFHELVHVVQWERLGADHFLLAYAVGLATATYENSPLEQMAYSLQQRFEFGTLPDRLLDVIETATDGIWNYYAPQVLPPT